MQSKIFHWKEKLSETIRMKWVSSISGILLIALSAVIDANVGKYNQIICRYKFWYIKFFFLLSNTIL